MAFELVPMASGIGADGSDQNLVAALLARRQAAARQQAAGGLSKSQEVSFSPRSNGQAALGYGAVIGNALLDRAQARKDQDSATQAAGGVAEFAKQLGGPFANITPQQVLALQLSNPEGLKTLMGHASEAAYRKPEFINAPPGNNVYSVGGGPAEQGGMYPPASQGAPVAGNIVGGPPRPGPASPAPSSPTPTGVSVIQQGAPPRLADASERQRMIDRGQIEPTDKRPIMVKPDGTFDFVNPPMNVTASASTGVNPIQEGLASQFLEGRKGASGAADSIRTIHEARKQLDSPGGIYSGFGAERRMDLARVGSYFGVTDPTTVQNTQAFRSAIGNSVLNQAKTLGANPSNEDRDYIKDVMAGNIALDDKSIRRVLDIQEGLARGHIQRYNATAGKVLDTLRNTPGADQNGLALMDALGPVAEPDAYKPLQSPQQSAVAQQAMPSPTSAQSAPALSVPDGVTPDMIAQEIQRRMMESGPQAMGPR